MLLRQVCTDAVVLAYIVDHKNCQYIKIRAFLNERLYWFEDDMSVKVYVTVGIIYILKISCSESLRLTYIFSFWGLIDLLSALPIIFLFK